MGDGLTLYLDASALVKAYATEESGSDLVRTWLAQADGRTSCQPAYLETMLALHRRGNALGIKAFKVDWETTWIIDVDQDLCERAVEVGAKRGLRTLDAIHLAAARLIDDEFAFATWDRRLHTAARAEGFATLPESLD